LIIVRACAVIVLLVGLGLCFVNLEGSILQFIVGVLCMLLGFFILCLSEKGG
jgi:hypothetical protein